MPSIGWVVHIEKMSDDSSRKEVTLREQFPVMSYEVGREAAAQQPQGVDLLPVMPVLPPLAHRSSMVSQSLPESESNTCTVPMALWLPLAKRTGLQQERNHHQKFFPVPLEGDTLTA